MGQREESLAERDHKLEQKLNKIENRSAALGEREEAVDKELASLESEREQLKAEQSAVADRLAEVAGLSREEAQQRLLDSLDAELQEEQGRLISKRIKDAEENAKVKARELVSRAVQRYAAEHTAETTTAKVIIPDEEMKGRIIGKEGRNIRAFSQATGVDVIIDDAPAKSPFPASTRAPRNRPSRPGRPRRNGRIHPARIEDVMTQAAGDGAGRPAIRRRRRLRL